MYTNWLIEDTFTVTETSHEYQNPACCLISASLDFIVPLLFPSLIHVFISTLPLQYGIVLDAGSSHTALYIYKWPAGKENGTGVVAQHSECQVKGIYPLVPPK